MLTLNIISDRTINKDILLPLDTYDKLVSFIHDPRFIRIGTIESVRTVELATAFNKTMNENVAYQSIFPRLMKRFAAEYPNLSITKQVKNYGIIYKGIGLTTDPVPQQGTAVLLQKVVNEKYIVRDKTFLDKAEKQLCQRWGWSCDQYRQMGTLGLIDLIKHEEDLDIDATTHVIIGRLFEYIHKKNLKLKEKARYAFSIKVSFEKAIEWDALLSDGNGTPVYTNRLSKAETTYYAGEILQKAINSYIDRIRSLPTVNILSNPNIEELNTLAKWLKNNSMHKTRLDMKIQQEAADPEPPQAINWTIEGDIKYHVIDTQLETED